MTFARPINLQAGPTPGTCIFLGVMCLFAIFILVLSSVVWTVKLAGAVFAAGCFFAGRHQLASQRRWQIIIYNSGAINIGPSGNARHPVEITRGGFCSRVLVTLPLRTLDGTRRFFLVKRANNTEDDFRRLRVWMNVSQAYN